MQSSSNFNATRSSGILTPFQCLHGIASTVIIAMNFPELKCIVGLKCNQFFWNFSKSLRCTVLLTSGALLTSTHSRELHRAVLHCGTLGPSHSSTLSTGQVGSCCIASMLNSHIPPPPPLNTCCVAKMPLTALKTFQKPPPKDALHCKALMLNSSYPSLSRPAMLPTCR